MIKFLKYHSNLTEIRMNDAYGTLIDMGFTDKDGELLEMLKIVDADVPTVLTLLQ